MRYTHELRCDAPLERFAYRPGKDFVPPDEPAEASLTLSFPGVAPCTIIECALTWDPESGLLWADLDTRGLVPMRNIRAEIRYQHLERAYRRLVYLDLLPDPWRPELTGEDLAALAPLAAMDRHEAAASYETLIGEAEEQIRLHLLSRGVAPGLVHNRAALDRCHRLLALSLVHLRAADGPTGGMWAKQAVFREQYERALGELLSVAEVDRDLDGARNDPPTDLRVVRLSP